MPDRTLRAILAPMVNAVVPDPVVAQHEAGKAVIAPDRTVKREAVSESIPWQQVSWYLESPVIGENVGLMYRLPQGGMIRHVSMIAKTPPIGGAMHLLVTTRSGDTIPVSLEDGVGERAVSMSLELGPGSVLSLDVLAVNGADMVTVSVFYGGMS